MKFNLLILVLVCSAFMTGLVSALPVANNDSFNIYLPTDRIEDASMLANDDSELATTYSDFVLVNTTSPHKGNITAWDNFTGLFSYVLDSGSTGVDFFKYMLTNGTDNSSEAWVVIAVSDNTAPSFNISNTTYYTDNASNYSLQVFSADGLMANLTNTENDTLFIVITEQIHFGELNVSSDGSFNYTAWANKTSGVDFFKYKISDLDKDSAEILVIILLGNNTAPTATADVYSIANASVTANDVNVTGNVLDNDTDADLDVKFTYLNSTTQNGTLDFNSDGSFTYYSNVSFVGIDSFTYYVSDQNKTSEIVNVTIYVNTSIPVATTTTTTTTTTNIVSSGGGSSKKKNTTVANITNTTTNVTLSKTNLTITGNNTGNSTANTTNTNATSESFLVKVSTITGAVIGAAGLVDWKRLVLILILIVVAYFLIRSKIYSKKKSKAKKAKK